VSAAVVVLPRVWASLPVLIEKKLVEKKENRTPKPVVPEMAFYRKYTEALLQRYVTMSMEAGRVPSLLGRELFRGNVTHYRVKSFEDVVVFVLDVEKCLAKLDRVQQYLIRRISLQQYTHEETAGMMRLSTKTVARQYGRTVDRLTEIFLEAKLLEPLRACQEAWEAKVELLYS
jgi:hypothetical protein